MRPVHHLLILLILIVFGPSAVAADSVAIRLAIDDFLGTQIKGLPGKASYSIGAIDADRLPGTCDSFDVSMNAGARPWGKTQVAVNCRGANWKLWVPVQIRVVADYLVVARPVNAGQTLVEDDVRTQSGELSDLPIGVVTNKSQVVGRSAIAPLVTGRPLRTDMLRLPLVVQQGQNVKIVGTGSGFQVSNEGRALGSAMVGQVVQVRLNSGKIVNGVALSDGAVEIRF